MPHDGGCLCGRRRFRLAVTPVDSGFCHCRICQKASGAPMALFASVTLADFAWTAGEPEVRQSSPFGKRWFCNACGTQLAMRVDHEPNTIDVSVMALDDPAVAPPRFHIWCESAQPWSYPLDTLPHYPRDRRAGVTESFQ
jgi:hypothetical protein